MHNVYVLVEDIGDEPVVDGYFEFEIVPRAGDYFTIASLGKDAIFEVERVLHHATGSDERLSPLVRVEIKAKKLK